MSDAKKLAKQLKNIGPVMAAKMIGSGIDSPESLRRIGAKKAFDRMYEYGDRFGDFNSAYLLALEGAIRGCDWAELPEATQRELKHYAQTLQADKRENSPID